MNLKCMTCTQSSHPYKIVTDSVAVVVVLSYQARFREISRCGLSGLEAKISACRPFES